MNDKQKFTVVTLTEREGFSREEIETGACSRGNDDTTRTFVVAAPLEAVVLTMNQPLVAVEMLADMARRHGKPLPKGGQKESPWAGDSRRFTLK